MTDDDKALVERLRDFVIAEDIDLAADRIEALSAENERLLDIDEVKANAIDSLLNDLASAEQENERLREALRDVLVYAPDFMHGMPKKHYEKIANGNN